MIKIPVVLNGEDFMKNLQSPSNIEHMAILTFVYSAGLRVEEVVKLKSEGIDSGIELIHIRCDKG